MAPSAPAAPPADAQAVRSIQALQAAQAAQTARAGSAPQATAPLSPVRTAPTAELPVQRVPATPATTSLAKFVSPQRTAEARVTAVTAHRDGEGGENKSGGGGGGSHPPSDPPPAYSPFDTRTSSPAGDESGAGFDARTLSDGQVDELTHRLIGPLSRLLRTELRMDRERIGRLRDSRR